ncbi:hypothetical protein D3C87_125300 [compost metagenome]
MLTNEAVYESLLKKSKSKDQYKEIPGKVDHPWIKAAHNLCGIHGKDIDATVPWCSSGMNLEVVGEGLKRNAGRMIKHLLDKGRKSSLIQEICDLYSVDYTLRDNGLEVELPALSAAAKSWREIGVDVPFADAQRGDYLVFKRYNKWGKVVGHHIAVLDEDKLGRVFVRALGCNQSNKICSSNTYLRSSLVSVRRSRV